MADDDEEVSRMVEEILSERKVRKKGKGDAAAVAKAEEDEKRKRAQTSPATRRSFFRSSSANAVQQAEEANFLRGRPESSKIELFKFVEAKDDLKKEMFPQEWKALEEIKKATIASHFSERFIAACLFARKMNLKRTEELLEANWKWRSENNWEKVPKFAQLDHSFIQSGLFYQVPGARSLNGQGVIYLKAGEFVPSEFDITKIIEYFVWNGLQGTEANHCDFHRNGVIFVQDLSGFTWKNFSVKAQSFQLISKAFQDHFPLRIEKVFILNPPKIMKALLTVCKPFLKKKILERFMVVKKEDLVNHIPSDQLPKEFGGSLDYSGVNYYNDLFRWVKNHKEPEDYTAEQKKDDSYRPVPGFVPSEPKVDEEAEVEEEEEELVPKKAAAAGQAPKITNITDFKELHKALDNTQSDPGKDYYSRARSISLAMEQPDITALLQNLPEEASSPAETPKDSETKPETSLSQTREELERPFKDGIKFDENGKIVIDSVDQLGALLMALIHEAFYNPESGLWPTYDEQFSRESYVRAGNPGWDSPHETPARNQAREPINQKKNRECEVLLKSDFANLVVDSVITTMKKQGFPVKRKEVKHGVKNHIRHHLYNLIYVDEP